MPTTLAGRAVHQDPSHKLSPGAPQPCLLLFNIHGETLILGMRRQNNLRSWHDGNCEIDRPTEVHAQIPGGDREENRSRGFFIIQKNSPTWKKSLTHPCLTPRRHCFEGRHDSGTLIRVWRHHTSIRALVWTGPSGQGKDGCVCAQNVAIAWMCRGQTTVCTNAPCHVPRSTFHTTLR